jgi:cytochrome c2
MTRRAIWITLVLLLVAGGSVAWEIRQEHQETLQRATATTGGNPQAGQEAVLRYGCGSCHTIPGVTAARGRVGPPLAGIAERMYVAGVLPNTPDNMMSWIQNPPALSPRTVMPNLGVTALDARDITAFLYTLKEGW